jgi:hypothetical protein
MPIFPAAFASLFAALRKHAALIALAVALTAAALLVHSYLDARKSAAQLADTIAAQQKIIADADARQSARDAALTQTLAQIDALKRAVQTPQQASAALANALPNFIASSIAPTTNSSVIPRRPAAEGSPAAQFDAGVLPGTQLNSPNAPPIFATLPSPLQFIPYPNSPAAKQGSGVSGQSPAAPNNSPGTPSANILVGTPQPNNVSGTPIQQNVVILSPPRRTKDQPKTETARATEQTAGPLSSLKSEISNVKLTHPVTPPSTQPDSNSTVIPRRTAAEGYPGEQFSPGVSPTGQPAAPTPQHGGAVTPVPG